MYRLLLLLLLSGPALATESVDGEGKQAGCPTSSQIEAPVDVPAPATRPGAPPALKSSDGAVAEPDQRPRARSRSPAWHSFLPGMFK
jgi:hypothetical protein